MDILHLEDASSDAELIARVLRREWPECRIHHVATGEAYLAALTGGRFDVILSDYSMPSFDGLTALAEARTHCPQTPFLFLSGMIGEERAVDALKCGAADYIIKDRPARLVPAIQSALTRRQSESRLRQQASLLDKAGDAIWATDADDRITYWNASAERMYGSSAADVIGRKLNELALGFAPDRLAEARAEVLAKGEWRGEFRLARRGRAPVVIDSTWSLVAEGAHRSILAIDTDVTERKKLEAQLLRSQRLESIGTLAGGVAHDLNNVLTPIILTMDVLAANILSPDDRRLIEKARASATHGAALVRQLLAFARGGEGERVTVELTAALAGIEPLIRQCLPPSITFSIRHADGPWPILANVTQLNQVLVNLVLNARDAMPQGGELEIATENRAVDASIAAANPGVQPGRFLCLTVSDSGTGVPRDVLDRIFDPFFTTKPFGKGTGLGLSMVAGIVKSHGGFVQVESEFGHGTSFHLYFPAIVAAEPPAREAGARARSGEGVLLVDDEPAVRDTLGALLQRAGYSIVPAEDAGSALRQYEDSRDRISLVITDMMLPDRSGVEVVKALRARAPNLPIIAISGMMSSGAFDELLRLDPPVQCLAKPLLPRVLLSAADRALHAAAV